MDEVTNCTHPNKAYAEIPTNITPPRQGKWICKDCGAYGHVPPGQTPQDLVVEGEYDKYVEIFEGESDN